MPANTPWCPRCGAWRGYVAPLCKGCVQIEANITTDMLVAKRQQLLSMAQTPEQVQQYNALTETQLRTLVLREQVQTRFVKISEMRTDREAFTQTLEEMVERNVDVLKSVALDWMRMRPESRRVRFSNMFAMEIVEVAKAALEELGAVSLELSKFTENKPAHDERMQRIMYGMQTVEKFLNPDGNDPADPPDPEEVEEEGNDDAAPGSVQA